MIASTYGVTRTTFTLDQSLAERARELGINISAAAHEGVAAAVARRSPTTIEPLTSGNPSARRVLGRRGSVDRGMNRGEIWLAEVGRKRRPVLVLTRSHVIDVRELVTVAEVTTTVRGIGVEVSLEHDDAGLSQPSVVNCDGIHTVAQSTLSSRVGVVSDETMDNVCSAISYALDC